ncbi:MAG: DUF11 domain-containing protein [Methanobrevibacter sp.]|nr:DUF11 domain-containing protein [Methanobrevibacter sp.]
MQYVNYTNQGNWTIGKITTYNVTLPGEGLVNFTNIVFTYKGNLSANQSTNFTITFNAKVNGTLVNTVNLTTNETGSKIFNATNTTTVINNKIANLTVTKLALNTTVVVGDRVYFMVVVNNTGDFALGNVTVHEIYDFGKLTLVDYNNHDLWERKGDVFTYKGVLDVNKTANFTVWFITKVNGTVVNTVNASSNLTGNKTAKNDTLVISPNMTVTKLALNKTVVIGDKVYFMVVVNNNGDCDLADVVVSEIYDSGKLTLVDYDNHDLWDVKGDVFIYNGVLARGESANFTVWFTTNVNGTVVNTVNASSNLTGNKSAVNDTLVISPNMAVTKLALNKTVVIGDKVYFMVVVTNTGDCDLSNVTVSEIYDSGKLTLVDYDDHDLWDVKGDVFTYNGVLARGESANFTVWFTANVNGTVVNTVNASSNLTENKSASNDTLVISPNMTVTKLALNTTVVIGNNVYFMVVVNNNGDCDLADVVVTEIYDSGKLTLVDYDNHDLWDLKDDVFNYKGVLAAGESANFTVWFTANVNGTIINTVNASSNLTENKTSSNETKVINPDMTVEKLTVNKTVIVGDKVIFTIVVTNTGDTVLGNISVKENIPEGLSYGTFHGPGWEKVGDYIFNYTGELAPGVSTSFNITLNADEGGLWENSVVASSNMTDDETAENTTFVHGPGIEVEKYALNATVVMGDYVYFMIVVNNTGDYPLHDVRVTEIFDSDELDYVNHTDRSVWIKSGNVFSYNGVLAVNGSANFTVWFTTKVNGTIVNTVNATSRETGNVTTHNETLVINPHMTVQKLFLNRTVYIDEKVIFTIVVTNTGDCDLGNISVREVIPDGLTYEAISGDDWIEAGDYVFNYTATLTPGNSTSFNITFIAHEGGNWTNTVIAESNMTEDVVANNTTYVMGPGLDVSKVSLNTTTIVIGDYAYFMITVKNTGDCDLGDVTVVEFFNSNELEYVNHTDRTVWVKEDNAFKYQGVLSEGASSNFTVGFRTLTNGVLVNNVTAKSNVTEDLNSSANVTVISPDMTVEKLALNTTVVVGNDVYFMIVVTNTGDCDLADVVVTEIYDSAKLTLVDFDNKNLWNLTCDVFTYNGVLAAGESANFTVWFTAKVNGTIANTVNASSNMTENRTANNETLVVNPDMTVQKLTVNKTVMVDDKVIFTIVVTNTGDCDLGDISIRENIPEGLSYSTFYGPGWEEVGDYIFNYTGILAPGVSASFNITLNANEGGLWENSVAASSNLTEEKTAKNTTFVHGPGIEVEKYALNATVVMGDHVYYMIVVNNTGDHPLHDVRVSEIFNSDEMTYVNHTDSSLWTKTGDVFTYNGVLAVNESASFTIWFTAKVNGTIVNTVNATSKETKNVTTHNSTLVVNPDMTVEKITLNETVVIGDDVYFMIVVTNTGDCDLSDVVVKESYSSDELTLKDFSNKDLWTRSSDVFTYNGVLAPGESANFTVWFTTKVNGTVVNTVNASSNMTENKTSKNTTDVEKELCDLEISKLVSASDVYVNHFVEWTIIVVNNGPFTAKDVIVNDTLPQGIEIISCSHAYEQKGDSLIWKLGDVEVNDPVEIMLFTRVLGEGELENFVCVNTTTDESDYDNNNASNTTFVNPICDLIINKTVNASNVYVNDSVEWTITVINVGPSIALNVKVADTLPEGAVILSYDTHSVGSFDEETRIWEIGQLNANEPVSLVLVTKIIAEGRITNVVTVNTTTTESDETNNAANNTTVADPVCDLIITKAVNASSIHTGDSVEWTIAVVNVGPSAAENVKVTDILPQGTVILAYDTHSVGSFDEETRIWEIGQLNANEPVSLVLVTKILTDGNITNKASVDTSTYEPDKTNNEANNTTVANPICDLEIVKVADSITVNINENVIWTIIVTNHGPSAALNVVVEDVLPDSLTLIGTKASVGSYSNGIWMIGNLGVNASETLELTTQAVELGTITNVASVNSTTPDSDESNNKAQNTTEVLPVCDLEITKLVNASSVDVKGLVEWTITVVNNGPCTARDVTVSDVLPDGLKLISATPSVGSYTDGIWTIGDLTSSSSQTLVLITQVLNEGPVENIVTVDSTTPDSDKSNNKANNTTVANPVCDLEVIKLVATKKAYVGNELIWTIIVTNNGPSQAKDVKVSENIPSSLEFVRYAATKGTYDKNSQIWTIGELDNASSVTLTLVTKVLSVGNITNPVEVTTTTPDSDKTNNKANNTTEAFEICDVAIVMSTDKKVYHVGDEMHWIMEVVNYGPSPAKDVVVSDVLPEGVKFISSSASKGSYSQYTGEWNIGDLAVGEKVTIDILCKVMAEGVIVNHARVSTSTNESDLTNNQDNASVKVIKNEPHVDPDEPDEPTPEPDEPISTEPPVEMTMRNTGNPIVYLLAAIFAIFGSFWVYRKEE